MCLGQLGSLLQRRKLVELGGAHLDDYERPDLFSIGYVAVVMAQPFGGVARMKLFGLMGSRELAAKADLDFM